MAGRTHARMQTALWKQEDWRALTAAAQWAYEMLCQQQALTYAGVIDFRPGRFSALASDQTPRKVEAAIKALEDARYVVVDRETEELLIRTYVRHDGVLDRVNMGKAVGRALDKVVSLDLRRVVLAELGRHYAEFPSLLGWQGLGDLYPDVMDIVTAMSSTIPLPMPSRMR